MQLRALRSRLADLGFKRGVRVEDGMAFLPIKIDPRLAVKHVPERPAGKLDMLPSLDVDLKSKYERIDSFTGRMSAIMKDAWDSQTVLNQLYGGYLDWKHVDPEQRAWDDAVSWIAKRHAPPEPEPEVRFDWNWPGPDYERWHDYEECEC